VLGNKLLVVALGHGMPGPPTRDCQGGGNTKSCTKHKSSKDRHQGGGLAWSHGISKLDNVIAEIGLDAEGQEGVAEADAS